jgi:hypothetical protein
VFVPILYLVWRSDRGKHATGYDVALDLGEPELDLVPLLRSQATLRLVVPRSDRLFCETLDYNILFRWFLDMGVEEPSFDASTFSKNRERLAGEEVALRFFDAVLCACWSSSQESRSDQENLRR